MGEANTVPMRINGIEGAAGQVKVSGGPGVLETWGVPAAGINATNGTYTGNDTANRAIPHGLGRIPKIYFWCSDVGASWGWGLVGSGYLMGENWTNGVVDLAVTVPTTTNFYVGNAGSYINSGNVSGETYYWVAIG